MDSTDMEFIEQPLSYKEALAQVLKFERLYKVRSEEFFASVEKGSPLADVHPEDFYEWRSYFAFKSDLDSRVAALLRASEDPIQEVEYELQSDPHPRVKGQTSALNNNLALVA